MLGSGLAAVASLDELGLGLGLPDSQFELRVLEVERAVPCGLLVIVGEDELGEGAEDVPLAAEEHHPQELEVLEEVEASVHQVEQALVHQLVLILDYLDHALLYG